MPTKRKQSSGKLVSWRPGESGNPGGRPIDHGARTSRIILQQKIPAAWLRKINRSNARRNGPQMAQGSTFLECATAAQIVKACLGDTDAYKACMTRAYGSVQKNQNVVIDGDVTINLSVDQVRQKLETFFADRNSEDQSQNTPALLEPEHADVIDVETVPAEPVEASHE